jgi:hypothetical protein
MTTVDSFHATTASAVFRPNPEYNIGSMHDGLKALVCHLSGFSSFHIPGTRCLSVSLPCPG